MLNHMVGERPYTQVLNQPCCWHKSILNWRRFTSSKKVTQMYRTNVR